MQPHRRHIISLTQSWIFIRSEERLEHMAKGAKDISIKLWIKLVEEKINLKNRESKGL